MVSYPQGQFLAVCLEGMNFRDAVVAGQRITDALGHATLHIVCKTGPIEELTMLDSEDV